MKKKYLIIFLLTLFFLFFLINKNIGNKDSSLNLFKQFIPSSIKNFLKEKLFVYKNQKELKYIINQQNLIILDLKKKIIEVSLDEINFLENDPRKKNLEKTNDLKIFSSDLKNALGPRGYLQNFQDHLFFITGTGKLFFSNIGDLKGKIINFKSINSNFSKIVGVNYLKKNINIVNHFLIKDNKLYISYNKKISENCFFNSIAVSNLNFEKMIFKDFIIFDECAYAFSYSAGGRLSSYEGNEILLTIGDHDPYSNKEDQPQKMDNLYGKTIKINTLNKKFEIISFGHRNSQGLFYDKKDKVIFSTDHGPKGGDEINLIQNLKIIPNFGWPISSYGAHYIDTPSLDPFTNPNLKDDQYVKQPLKKSHEEFGFTEPIFFWKESSPPTQILKINLPNINMDKLIYVSVLGKTLKGNHKSLHKFKFSKDYKLKDHKILKINERIRDMIYLEKENTILLYLEESGSIATLNLN